MDPMSDAWVGLREDDRDAARRRGEAVPSEIDAGDDAAALALGHRIAQLPDPEVDGWTPSARRVPWAGAALAATAVIAVVAAWSDAPLASRGLGTPPPVVVLRGAVVADGAAMPLGHHAEVSMAQAIAFEVETTSHGTLTILEDGEPIWPRDGVWRVDAGRHGMPKAWRSDTPGRHDYMVSFCPDAAPCVTASMEVVWAP